MFGAMGGVLTVLIAISANHHRDGALWLGCAAVCAFVISGFCWYQGVLWDRDSKDTASEPFVVKSSWVMNQEGGAQMWAVRSGVVIHVPTALVVYFTNLKSTPIMIFSSFVEQETAEGKWENVSLPFGSETSVFLGSDLKDVVEWKYPTFDLVSENKNIGSGETISGWLLLTKRPTRKIRLGIIDASGATATEVVGQLVGSPLAPTIESTHVHSDISQLPRNP